MISTLLTFLAVGVVSLVVVWIVLTVVGSLLGLTIAIGGFLFFKVVPIMLLGWLVLKVVSRVRGRDALPAADRQWLERE